MIGIDIAGVALGALPLACLAVEQAIKALSTIQRWRRYERTYLKYANMLERRELWLRLHLQQLLWPLVVDHHLLESDLETLVAEPRSAQWNNRNANIALKNRLAEAHDTYMKCLESFVCSVLNIATNLGTRQPAFQAMLERRLTGGSTNGKIRLMERAWAEMQRLRITTGGKRLQESLSELESIGRDLDWILSAIDNVSAFRHRRTATTEISKRWRNASGIHKLVATSWHCDCQGQHPTFLWLEHPHEAKHFLVLHVRVQHDLSDQAAGSTFGKDIYVTAETSMHPGLYSNNVSTSLHASPQSYFLTNPSTNTSERRDSASGLPHQSPSNSAQLAVSAARSSTQTSPRLSPCTNIKNCMSMPSENFSTRGDYSYLGILEDPGEKLSCTVYERQTSGVSLSTLSSLWESPESNQPTLADRYLLAFVLSSAYLDYFLTPWLNDNTDSDNICISKCDGQYRFQRPLITTIVQRVDNSSGTAMSCTKKEFPFQGLAIILLELCFGKRIERQGSYRALDRNINPDTRTATLDPQLTDIADSVQYHLGHEYQHAVRWCLQQECLVEEQWQEEFAFHVVSRLQNGTKFF